MSKRIMKVSDEAIAHLSAIDPLFLALIERAGILQYEVEEPFPSMIGSIISQQISTKAAVSIQNKLTEAVGSLSPQPLFEADGQLMRECGLSARKVDYIKEIAGAALSGTVDFDRLYLLDDDEVIRSLTALKGVGRWTVEMLLIFSLCRPDIISYADLGIRRGMMRLYGMDQLSVEEFEVYRKKFSPYGSAASLYLWRGL